MSEIRRILLMYHPSKENWTEVARFTNTGTTTINLPVNNYSELGFFIVGGGGGGHGDFGNARSPGNAGNGGCVNHFIVTPNGTSFTVTVGRGGLKGESRNDSYNGTMSSVVYNNHTYLSHGGNGGNNTLGAVNTKQENSGIGGFSRWGGYVNQDMYQWCSTHTALEIYPEDEPTFAKYGGKGEDGLPNPFDEFDTNLYGAGGGASQNAYEPLYVGPAISGGTTGGGDGGYGSNNTAQNKGQNATFYGGGGGGGAFSSDHTYSQGGAGYQGIVIIYGR